MQSTGDILIVDNDAPTVAFIAELLTDEGYTVRTAFHASCAHAAIAMQRPDLVLLDLHLPDKTGDILVQELNDDGLAHVPVVMMTADTKAAQALSMEGIAFCLIKPFDLDELLECVANYIQRNRVI